ncbi:hypothetical protein KL86CLO1_12572 [uncultured Eubacteriales bacterium]|uniref:Uncharacterized protein n=1 Tax=uncultured Eubacteriales bacterium TaxID=172733 RepID=A0A212KBL9_9FIRM|nr:hypothetical protein KL86CLO1_12572 [uncultured Eubacteriales bacterium]
MSFCFILGSSFCLFSLYRQGIPHFFLAGIPMPNKSVKSREKNAQGQPSVEEGWPCALFGSQTIITSENVKLQKISTHNSKEVSTSAW